MSWGRGGGGKETEFDWSGDGNGGVDVQGDGFRDPFDGGSGADSSGWNSNGTDDGMAWGTDNEGATDFDGMGDERGQQAQPRHSIRPQTQPSQAPWKGQKGPQQGMSQAETRRRLGYGKCVVDFLVNGVQACALGSIIGVFSGYHEAYSAGARGKTLVLYVLSRAKSSAFSFGAWIGSYSGSKCAFITFRDGKRDALNAFLAGGVAGALPAIASRNPRTILFSALGSAGFMGAMESLEGLFAGESKGQERGSAQ